MTRSGAGQIAIDGVDLSFTSARGAPVPALAGLDLSVPRNSFLSIVGPSGCGKTTLLRLVAGLIAPDAGRVLIDGAPPRAGRQSSFVFQSFRLLPWKTAAANVAFALRPLRLDRAEREDRVRRYLDLVGLSSAHAMYPDEMSGGMKQRLALARALAVEARILLMDEPFASLDAQARELMQEELKRLLPEHGATVLFVTHSVDEALLLGDRLAMLSPRPGRVVEQVELPFDRGAPAEELRALPDFTALRDHVWGRIRDMVLSDPASDFHGRGLARKEVVTA